MSSNARRFMFLLAVLIVFALPKRVDCGYPGAKCAVYVGKDVCSYAEIEPYGFYLLESLLGRDVGFAYTRETECR